MKSLKKVSSGIGALKRVRPFVSMHTAIKIYKGLIEPHFDYCSAVWDGLTQQLSEKLLAMTLSSRFLLNSLSWDNLSVRRAKQKANLMTSSLIISPQLISVICLPQEHRITIFATRRKS